jgi:hypothetical protein
MQAQAHTAAATAKAVAAESRRSCFVTYYLLKMQHVKEECSLSVPLQGTYLHQVVINVPVLLYVNAAALVSQAVTADVNHPHIPARRCQEVSDRHLQHRRSKSMAQHTLVYSKVLLL